MPCPPLVPISIIPPVSQGPSPILWQNGNQITRLNTPLNPSWLVYDGTTTRWGDGSAQAPVYLPNIQEVNGPSLTYVAGITSTGQLVKTIGASGTALVGGVAGAVVYQSAPSVTSFTAAGTTGQSLLSGGTGTPTWGTPASATTATNIASGVAGAVPYQSGVGATAFTAAGTTNQVLHSNGTSAPTWSSVSPSNLSTGHPTWDTSGNVGIGTGTSSPSTNLQVNGAIAVGNGNLTSMSINNNFGGNDLLTLAEGPQGLRIVNSGNTAQHLLINSSGNLNAYGDVVSSGNVTGTNGVYAGFVSQVASNSFPYFQIYNSAAPTDKKFVRSGVGTSGIFTLERVNDAYNSATYILLVDASNNINTQSNPIIGCPTTAKAWVQFDGTTTLPTVKGTPYNVSSVGRNNTGDYTVNFSTALTDANYSAVVFSGNGTSAAPGATQSGYNFATGSMRVSTGTSTTGAPTNRAQICVTVFGR